MAIIPTNIRLVIIEIIVRFSCLGLSQRQMSRITGVSLGAIWKVLRRVRESMSFPGATCVSIADDHINRRLCPTPYRVSKILSASRITVELIRSTGRRVLVRMVPGHLLVAGYRSKHTYAPDWLLIIAAAAACWQPGPTTGTISRPDIIFLIIFYWSLESDIALSS